MRFQKIEIKVYFEDEKKPVKVVLLGPEGQMGIEYGIQSFRLDNQVRYGYTGMDTVKLEMTGKNASSIKRKRK